MTQRTSTGLCFDRLDGDDVCLIFCGGFNSNRQGNKALAFEGLANHLGIEYVRFDYRAHGQTSGDFADCTITEWADNVVEVIDEVAQNQTVVLVGSSMGGWLSLIAAQRRPNRVNALLLIACAADMTKFYPDRVSGLPLLRDHKGRAHYEVPNAYDDQQPYRIYQAMIDSGQPYYLLDSAIDFAGPVRLIHGTDDEVIPWQRSEKVLSLITSKQASLTLIKDGDHRLSDVGDIAIMNSLVSELITLVRV